MKTILLFLLAMGVAAAADSSPAETQPAPPSGGEASNIQAEDEIEIRAGTDSSKATIKGSLDISEGDEGADFTFSASAPLDKDNDHTRIATFDGFANSFSGSIGMTFHSLSGTNIPTFYGWTSSAGYKKFTYTDPTTFAEAKASKTPLSAGLFYGTQVGQELAFVVFGAEFKRSYKDQDAKGVVLPPDSSGVTFVRTGPYGSPKRRNETLLSVDFRRSLGKGFAGAIKVTYDLESDEYGIDVPLMFAGDGADKRWTGGIQVGYQSDKDDYYAAVIVGSPFKFMGK